MKRAICLECGRIMSTVKKGNADLCYDCEYKNELKWNKKYLIFIWLFVFLLYVLLIIII